MTIKVQLVFDRETKGALVFRERLAGGSLAQYPNSPGSKIGVLYIRKSAFDDYSGGSTKRIGYPKEIELTVEITVESATFQK